MKLEGIPASYLKASYWEIPLLTVTVFFGLLPLGMNLGVVYVMAYNIPLFALMTLQIALALYQGRTRFEKIDSWDWANILLLFFLFLSLLYSPNKKDSIPAFIQFMHLCYLGMYLKRLAGSKITPTQIITFVFVIAFLESFTSIVQQFSGTNFGNIKSYFGEAEKNQLSPLAGAEAFSRIQGTVGSANLTSAILLVCVPFLIIASFYKKFQSKRWWILRLVIFSLSATAIIFSFSRATNLLFIMIVVLAVPLYFYLKREHPRTVRVNYKRTLRTFVLLTGLLGVCVFLYYQMDIILAIVEVAMSRFNSSFETTSSAVSVDYRLLMIKSGIKYMSENPLIGIGIGNGDAIYQEVGYYSKNLDLRPHNAFILLGVEGGIICMVLFAYITLYPIFKLLSFWNNDPYRFALLGCLGIGLGLTQIYLITIGSIFGIYYFIILGLSCGYSLKKYQHKLY